MPKFGDFLKNVQEVLDIFGPEDSKLAIRDSRTAARMWGQQSTAMNRLPRAKFLFAVNFLRPKASASGKTRYGDWTNGIAFLIKSTTRPNLNFKTETLNQYNKKRVIQTGIEYEPISINFFDTYDQRVLQMLKEYASFYYGEFAMANTLSWNYDVTSAEYQNLAGDYDFGFKVNGLGPNDEYFFEKVEVYQFGGGFYNKFSLIHPKITSFKYDDEDYSEMTTPQMIDMTFNYEGIVFEAEHQKIDPALVDQFGLDLGDFHDIFFPDPRFNYPTIDDYEPTTPAQKLFNKFVAPKLGIPEIRETLPEEFINPSHNPLFSGRYGNYFYDALPSDTQEVFDIAGDFSQNMSGSNQAHYGRSASSLDRIRGVNRTAQQLYAFSRR